MGYIVKTEEREAEQEARHRANEDSILSAIGLSRADFPCFEGAVQADEHIVVWAGDEAHFEHEPRHMVSGGWSPTTGWFEYQFMLPVDTYAGPPTVDGY